jgi:hypothetical protein
MNRSTAGVPSAIGERQMETMEIMGSPVDDVDATDMDEEESMPDDFEARYPLSRHIAGWRFWWAFAKYPLALLLINTVVLLFLSLYNPKNDYQDTYNNDWETSSLMLMMTRFRVKCVGVVVMAFLDIIFLYLAAAFLRKDMHLLVREHQAQDSQAQSAETQSPIWRTAAPLPQLDLKVLDHVHARVAQKVDAYLHRDPAWQSTFPFLVSLLYLLMALAATASLTSVLLLLFVNSAQGMSLCTARDTNVIKFNQTDGVPEDLLDWANEGSSVEATYVRLSDGTLYFRGSAAYIQEPTMLSVYHGMRINGFHSIESDRDSNLRLLASKADGSVSMYSHVSSPTFFASVLEDNSGTSTSFCFLYKEVVQEGYDIDTFFSVPYASSVFSVACIDSKEDANQEVRNTTFSSSNQQELRSCLGRAYDGEYWVRQDGVDRHFWSIQEVQIVRVNPQTMVATTIANKTHSRDFRPVWSREGKCNLRIQEIGYSAAAVFLFIFALAMEQTLKIPSSAGCLAMSIVATLTWIDETLAGLLSLVLIIATAFYLIMGSPSLVVREQMLWGMYCVIILQLVFEFYPVVVFGLGLGIARDHPVLQLGGWIGGPFAVFFLLFYSITDSIDWLELVAFIPLSVLIACGMVTAGNQLTRYRPFLLFYLRRLWRSLCLKIRPQIRQQSRS